MNTPFGYASDDLAGGAVNPPEPQDWDPDRDGCPVCGEMVCGLRFRTNAGRWTAQRYICDSCDKVFDADGDEVK